MALCGMLLFRAIGTLLTASARVTLARTPSRCGSRIPEAGSWRLGGSRGVGSYEPPDCVQNHDGATAERLRVHHGEGDCKRCGWAGACTQ